MTKSSSRQRKGATKSAARLAAKTAAKGKPLAEVSLDPKVQGVKIAALEANLEKLVGVMRVNHHEILKAFSLTDAHQWVLLQIVKDVAAGTLLMLSNDPPVLDVAAYYELFNVKQRADAKKASAQTPTETQAEDHEVFGGDLSDENPQRDAGPEEGQGSGEDGIGDGDQQAPMQVRESGSAHAGA